MTEGKQSWEAFCCLLVEMRGKNKQKRLIRRSQREKRKTRTVWCFVNLGKKLFQEAKE